MFKFKHYDWKKYNLSLIIIIITLCIAGAFIVRLAGGEENGSQLFKKQLAGMALGLVVMVVVSLIDYHFICKFVILYYLAGLAMLFATRFTPLGTDLNTLSYRWIDIGFAFQPSEICKIIVILTLAVFYTKVREKTDKLYIMVLAILIVAAPTAIILVQSNLSSAMIMLFILAIMIFAAGTSYKIIGFTLLVTVPSFIAFFWYEVKHPEGGLLPQYQYNRIFSFLNPDLPGVRDLVRQQNNSVNAIASGRLYGNIIDPATASNNYSNVAFRDSDFIFSVIGEELGFIGCCVVIALLLVVVFKCLMTARKSMDYMGMMIATGVSAMFAFQIFANIGVATLILPNTGLPLPFFSSGISSMLGCMIAIGLVLNIGLQAGRNPHTGFSLSDL